jgi:hypothetical protein
MIFFSYIDISAKIHENVRELMSSNTDQKPTQSTLIWHCCLNNIIIYLRGPLNNTFNQIQNSEVNNV